MFIFLFLNRLTNIFPIFILCLFFIFANVNAQDDDSGAKKYKINKVKIEFRNTKTFSSDDIQSLLKTGTSEYFILNDFTNDLLRIEKFYFDNGYFDAFVDTATLFNDKKDEVDAIFNIIENSPYKISSVSYRGLESIGQELYNKFFKENEPLLKVKDLFNKGNLTQELARIHTLMLNNGFAYAFYDAPEVIKIESKDRELSHTVKLGLKFTTGNRFRFGKTIINISNNKYNISFREILRELEYNENDIYSRQLLTESEARLSRISILENSRIQVDNIDTVNNKINLKISANVRNKYEIQPEVFGYDLSNKFYAGVGLSFSDKYFFGGGRTQTLRTRFFINSLDVNVVEVTFDLYQPYIFKNNKITGNWKIGASLYNESEYRIMQTLNNFAINYELPKHTYVNLSLIHI